MSKTKVLVIDDSPTIQEVLSQVLASDHEIEVVGVAKDPYDAREKIKQFNPDVLTLDVEMPKMDGIQFLKNLMRLRPMPVVMISTLTQKGADVTIRAMELGAVDTIAKPKLSDNQRLEDYAQEIIAKVKAAAKSNVATIERIQQQSGDKKSFTNEREEIRQKIEEAGLLSSRVIVALGASTGGTEALKAVIKRLPNNFPPVVVVQHIPAGFSTSYAERVNSESEVEVLEATPNLTLTKGMVAIAPGSHHLEVYARNRAYHCRLSEADPVNKHRPSVEVLFDTVCAASGKHTIAGILTGMGRDGAEALLRLRDVGAFTFAQDEATSVVYGMPRAAVEVDAAQAVYPLDRIARAITDQVLKFAVVRNR